MGSIASAAEYMRTHPDAVSVSFTAIPPRPSCGITPDAPVVDLGAWQDASRQLAIPNP
jgi:hypothetical protein